MAKKGAFGSITFGDTPQAVGQIRSWQQNAEASEIDTTVMGTGNSSMMPGALGESLSCELFFEPADAGQALILAELAKDTPQAVNLRPFGTGSGLYEWDANCFVMSATTQSDADGAVEMSVTFQTDGTGGAWTAQP